MFEKGINQKTLQELPVLDAAGTKLFGS